MESKKNTLAGQLRTHVPSHLSSIPLHDWDSTKWTIETRVLMIIENVECVMHFKCWNVVWQSRRLIKSTSNTNWSSTNLRFRIHPAWVTKCIAWVNYAGAYCSLMRRAPSFLKHHVACCFCRKEWTPATGKISIICCRLWAQLGARWSSTVSWARGEYWQCLIVRKDRGRGTYSGAVRHWRTSILTASICQIARQSYGSNWAADAAWKWSVSSCLP